MVPSPEVDSDEGNADLGQAASQKETLPEVVPAVLVAGLFGFAGNVEGRLGFLGIDELVSLVVKLVDAYRRIVRGFVLNALQSVQALAQVSAVVGATIYYALRNADVANLEVLAVGTLLDDEGCVRRSKKVWSTRASHAKKAHVAGQAFSYAPFLSHH